MFIALSPNIYKYQLIIRDVFFRLVPKNPDGGNYLPILDTTAVPKRIGIDGFIGTEFSCSIVIHFVECVNSWVKITL